MVIAGITFFATMFLLLRMLPLGTVVAAAKEPLSASDDPSWKFHNPEIDQWVSQIKDERDQLAVREQQLKEWEARLAAESREIATVTQAVSRTQEEFDKRVLAFKGEEKNNLKKQIKVITDMSPDGASAMLNEMPDDQAAKLLYAMKPDESAAILDSMSKAGGESARRAGALADRMKDVLPDSALTNATANASR